MIECSAYVTAAKGPLISVRVDSAKIVSFKLSQHTLSLYYFQASSSCQSLAYLWLISFSDIR